MLELEGGFIFLFFDNVISYCYLKLSKMSFFVVLCSIDFNVFSILCSIDFNIF